MPTSTVGSRRSKSRGFTLIELLVGMAVVGIILSVVIGGVGNLLETEMKSASYRLAATLRYLYNKSVTERVYIRVVYNLEDHLYKVESTSEPFVITPEEAPGSGKNKQEPPPAKAPAEGEEEVPPPPAFTPEDSSLLKETKLGSTIYFKDIQVSYQEGKVEEGQAYTYFFPNGYVTPTVINLRDEDDETHYSLEVHPLSGRVQIRSEYRELVKE